MKRLRTSKVKLTPVRFLLKLEHKILLPERTFEWFSASQLNTWTFLRQDRRWRASTERNVNEGKRFDEELFEVTLLHRPPFSVSFIPKHNKYITDLDVKQQNEVVIVQTSPQVQISNHFISSVWVFLWFLHVRIIRTTNPISRLCSDPFVCVCGLKLIVRLPSCQNFVSGRLQSPKLKSETKKDLWVRSGRPKITPRGERGEKCADSSVVLLKWRTLPQTIEWKQNWFWFWKSNRKE